MDTRFISLEGIDFTWKSPISEWLVEWLKEQGYDVVLTRDPPYWLSPWDSFWKYFEKGDSVAKIGEAFMLLAARLDNFERVIGPALAGGRLVVADRFADSWFAYQSVRLSGYFAGADYALEFLLREHSRLQMFGLLRLPDLTLLIRDNPAEALGRAQPGEIGSKYDILELQRQVAAMYDKLAVRFPERIATVEINERGIGEIYTDVQKIVRTELERPPVPEICFVPDDLVEATRRISWTLGEFDDYPLVVDPKDRGQVTQIEDHRGAVYVRWNNDPFPKRRKCVLPTGREGWPIRKV